MKYIITENQNTKLKVLRRLKKIDEISARAMRMVAKYYGICERGVEFYIDMVSEEVCEVMFMEDFNDVDEDSQEFIDITTIIDGYIKENHSDVIKKYYKSWGCPDSL